jgi:uncharacterized protein (DUF427 family)
VANTRVDPSWGPGYGERFDYRVDLLRRRNLITAVTHDGLQLGRTERAILVDEQNHGLVFYFPRNDVDMSKLEKIDRLSHCPYKGVASYWALAGGDVERPVAWAYETPYPEVAQIADHIAFYQDRVTVSIGVAIFPLLSKRAGT